MNKTAALLLLLAFGLLTAGATMLAIPAGVITAGVLAAIAGVLSLNAGSRSREVKDDGKATQ